MGHSNCGAVASAIHGLTDENIGAVTSKIEPAVRCVHQRHGDAAPRFAPGHGHQTDWRAHQGVHQAPAAQPVDQHIELRDQLEDRFGRLLGGLGHGLRTHFAGTSASTDPSASPDR